MFSHTAVELGQGRVCYQRGYSVYSLYSERLEELNLGLQVSLLGRLEGFHVGGLAVGGEVVLAAPRLDHGEAARAGGLPVQLVVQAPSLRLDRKRFISCSPKYLPRVLTSLG